MKKLFTKMILVSFVLTFAITLQAVITNTYEWSAQSDLAGLSVQPQADDLTQRAGSKNHIMKGGMHDGGFLLSSLFNSDVDGSYGPDSAGIFIDDISPANDTVIHCDFAEAQTVNEVHVFTQWGDMRLFSWFEVWSSTTGTNDGDYSYLGTATFGEIGDVSTPYHNSNCVARLYDIDDGILATNVMSVRLIQKNCGYDGVKLPPGTNLTANIDSCACQELDIIGIPEPTTITNEFFWDDDLGNLPVQPLSDDLAQGTDATNMIITGGMHTALTSNFFEYLFNSPADGELGIGSPDTPAGHEVLCTDAAIPETLTMEMNCDFVTTTKTIKAIHVFSHAGDARLFTYGEVYSSADGNTYDYIGAVSFGDWGDSVGPYSNKQCVAKLYNSDTNKSLAENIISIKIIFRGVMDTTWVDYVHKLQGSSGGSAIGEIDIIGIDGSIPPPDPPLPPGPKLIYVGKYGTSNGSNYFTVIQEAVDVAPDDALILVSNGVYNTGGGIESGSTITNRVFCTKSIEIRSIDGPDSTIIVGAPDAGTGGNGPGAVRCVCFPWESGATLSGFTLSDGYTLTTGDPNREKGGGGARIRKDGLITNCVVVGNEANGYGGGINLQYGTVTDCKVYNNYSDNYAGGIFSQGGNIYNSIINDNESSINGGGVWFFSSTGEGGSISNSIISGNIASAKGGGVYLLGSPSNPNEVAAKIYDCTVSSNSAGIWGGGINIEFGGEVHRAKVFNNETENHSGGGIYLYRAGKVYDSLIYKNQSMLHGGGIFFDNVSDAALNGGEVYNCTIANNSTVGHGGGINMANSLSNYFGKIVNSIVYTNIAFTANPNWAKGPNGTSPFNCSDGPIGGLGGAGNISNNPEFVSIEMDDWRLLLTSPCINAGTNGEVTSTIDLDGNPRIEEGTVDMGCYESIPEPTIFVLLSILGLAFFWKK